MDYSTPRNAGNSPAATASNRKHAETKKSADQPARDEFTKASFTAAQKTLREQR